MSDILKRASWLELFYDLAFVALIAQLTYLAASHHFSFSDALHIFIVGYLIFVAWWGTTANRNLQNSEDTIDKLMVQLQMVGAFLMSLSMPDVFLGDMSGFFATFAMVRGIQVLMVLRMYRLYPDDAPQTPNIVQGIAIAACLWLVASFVPGPYFYIVAFAALVLDVLAPLTKGKGNKIRLLNINHLQERLGLFLMLVIGESMLVVALTNTATSVDFARPLIVISGMLLVISLWWLYFAYLERCADGVRPKNLFVFLHAHGFLFGGIVLVAAAYKNMLEHGNPTHTDLLLLGIGYLVITAALVIVRRMLNGMRRSKLIAAVLFCVAVGIVVVFGVSMNVMFSAVMVLTGVAVVAALLDYYKRTVYR